MAANPRGEEKSPAQSRGVTPARVAAIAALAIVVIVLAAILFGGDSGHKYNLLFQNASQLVPDNQVLIGGQPVGSVESIELTDDNLAEVKISIEQELHEGSTAIVRATSLSGVANHYVSIDPGPNDEPALEDGATLGLAETTTPADLDQLFNTFPPRMREGLANFIQGQAAFYSGRGEDGNVAAKYFGPALNRTNAFVGELNADQRLFERLRRQLRASSRPPSPSAATTSTNAISNATTAFGAIARQNVAFSQTLRRLPPVFRQSNTTFVNLRAALDDIDPLVETAKPATKNLAPFLRRTAAGDPESRAALQEPAPHRAAAGQGQRRRRAARAPCPPSSSGPPRPSRTPKRRSPTSSRTSTSPAPTRPTSSTASPSSARSPATTTPTATTRGSPSPTSTSSTTTPAN